MKIFPSFVMVGLVTAVAPYILPIAPASAQEAPRFTHVALVVDDLERMCDFYERVLGLTETGHRVYEDSRLVPSTSDAVRVTGFDTLLGLRGVKLEAAFFSDADGNGFLELLKFPDHPAVSVQRALNRPQGLNHVGLRVADIDGILEVMRAEGLGSVIGGPVRIPEFGSNLAVIIKDPEGNIVELSQRTRS